MLFTPPSYDAAPSCTRLRMLRSGGLLTQVGRTICYGTTPVPRSHFIICHHKGCYDGSDPVVCGNSPLACTLHFLFRDTTVAFVTTSLGWASLAWFPCCLREPLSDQFSLPQIHFVDEPASHRAPPEIWDRIANFIPRYHLRTWLFVSAFHRYVHRSI